MSKCIIVSSGIINDYSFYRAHICPDDYIICADGGIRHLLSMNVIPDLWIGDFDSCRFNDIVNDHAELKSVETVTLNTDKDVTDTHYACIEAIKRGYRQVILWGACGGRIDHMISNIHLLEFFADNDVNALIQDERNTLSLCRDNVKIIKSRKYISLLPLDKSVSISNSKGLKYPVKNYKLSRENSIGVSNEIIDEYAIISVESGSVLIVESDD